MVAYWLMKSELDVYPWNQLVEDEWTHWDGVRNYQARNMMRDELKEGDLLILDELNRLGRTMITMLIEVNNCFLTTYSCP